MQDADKKNIIMNADKLPENEEYEQLCFDFCKPDTGSESTSKPRNKVKAELPVEDLADEKDEDEGYEQLSFNFASSEEKSEPKPASVTSEKSELGEADEIAGAELTGEKTETAEALGVVAKNAENAETIETAESVDTVKTADNTESGVTDVTSGTEEKNPPRSRRKSCNKSHSIRKFLIGAAALSAAAYCVGIYFFSQHFLPNSYVQGVDISLLDAAEAEDKLQSELIYDSILLKGRTDDEALSLSNTDAAKTFSSMQEAINAQDKLLWAKPLFTGENDTGITFSVSCDEDKLNEELEGLSILNYDNIIVPANAHPRLNSDTNQYEIETEIEGNEIDTAALKEAVYAALDSGSREIDLEEEGVYTEPDIRSDNVQLSEQIDWMNLINKAGASLDLDAGVVIAVNGELVGALVGADGMADEQAVRNYVGWLAAAYNTAAPDKLRSFLNHNNEEKTIKTSYGWELNEDKTYTRLFELINRVITDTTVNVARSDENAADENAADAMQTAEYAVNESSDIQTSDNVSDDGAVQQPSEAEAAVESGFNPEDYAIKAVWKRTAAVHGENDIGQSYVEIDMGEQNVYIYVDGSCVLTTPCVTGKMTRGRITPEGMYQIQYKQKNRYLTGRNPDGSISYRSYVHYWMPFNGGIGLHDATWRRKFGDNIYVGSGSHGCINLPLDMAKQIYDIVYAGMPVICYY